MRRLSAIFGRARSVYKPSHYLIDVAPKSERAHTSDMAKWIGMLVGIVSIMGTGLIIYEKLKVPFIDAEFQYDSSGYKIRIINRGAAPAKDVTLDFSRWFVGAPAPWGNAL